MSSKKANLKPEFNESQTTLAVKLTWILGLFPLFLVICLLLFQPSDEMPSVEMLDNPPELLASVVLADDSKTELGRYWKINRTSAEYTEISPFVTDALISTEDERFLDHAGVDFRAIGRAVVSMGGSGGASTITQQLAKLLFTLQQRDRDADARARGESLSNSRIRAFRILGRVNEKARENIIATRLEKRYTKEEIMTMYLNQFDFLYNAVGIENATKVYFNKKPSELSKEEAAMLVGMCKNPTLFNPYSFRVKNYRRSIALNKGVPLGEVSLQEIQDRRSEDSLRAVSRRNQVLYQWYKNSSKNNKSLRIKLTREEYDSLKMIPITTNYQVVDHKQGFAPYFRESMRQTLIKLFQEKNDDGDYKYQRPDGQPWNIYNDGLKIFTTINPKMQEYAEAAVDRHLSQTLQPEFDRNNRRMKNFPFSRDLDDEQINRIMRNARRISLRYAIGKEQGKSESELEKEFNIAVPMRVFSWRGEIDTTMTPNDSIRYYKSYLHAGLLSIEPETGFIKAWVGGANIDHFAYDHVRQGRRQVGSTIKPFVYATALSMGVSKPCTSFSGGYCVDLQDGSGNVTGRWCPKGEAAGTMAEGLALSSNPTTVAVMSKMGGYAGPKTISKFLKQLNINLRPEDEVPSMCLGPMDLSLYEMVPAQAMFVNQGVFMEPSFILRIEDRNGNVIYSAKPDEREVINQNVAYQMLKMMQGTINFGTGASLRSGQSWGGISAPTAGKTGTTQNNSDGWFVGLTPDLVTGIWVGAEDRAVRFTSMAWGQGSRMALPIYGYFMQKVYKDPDIALRTNDFDVPAGWDPKIFQCGGEEVTRTPENPFF